MCWQIYLTNFKLIPMWFLWHYKHCYIKTPSCRGLGWFVYIFRSLEYAVGGLKVSPISSYPRPFTWDNANSIWAIWVSYHYVGLIYILKQSTRRATPLSRRCLIARDLLKVYGLFYHLIRCASYSGQMIKTCCWSDQNRNEWVGLPFMCSVDSFNVIRWIFAGESVIGSFSRGRKSYPLVFKLVPWIPRA